MRYWRAPGVWSATAPAIQTSARPSAATRMAPPMPSTTSAPGNASRRRIPTPTASKTIAARPPTISAVTRLKSGAYGELDPCSRSSGRQPAAGERSAGEARQRQPADDEALAVAPQRHQRDEPDDDPVDRRHAAPSFRASCACCAIECPPWKDPAPSHRPFVATRHGARHARGRPDRIALGALLVIFNPFGLAVAGLVLAVGRRADRRTRRTRPHAGTGLLAGRRDDSSCSRG